MVGFDVCTVENGSWPSGSASGDHSHRGSPLGSTASLPYQLSQSEVHKLLKSMPLEEPKRVACSVCKRRFKNQSALNGHMRLHGGYGPPAGGEGVGGVADVTPLRVTSASSISTGQVSPTPSKLKDQISVRANVISSNTSAPPSTMFIKVNLVHRASAAWADACSWSFNFGPHAD
ncbi:unnamed protein product [Schistocephalus solidus]|uniref:C2H2-type domain-containing protein n=1 Tax=Schistocephalus solidus TaxID=70667 RepID=A0A183TJ25_SCHSO|nr:unnamed protein product [Schistocephalus solidus]